jgi:hypothetical protein
MHFVSSESMVSCLLPKNVTSKIYIINNFTYKRWLYSDTSETLVNFYQTTRRYNQEESQLHPRRR